MEPRSTSPGIDQSTIQGGWHLDTLKPLANQRMVMKVTVEVVGEDTHHVSISDATFADLIKKVGLSPHEATALVDGQPVPDDRLVEVEQVTVLRLIKGG